MENSNAIDFELSNEKPKRTTFILVLCILSWSSIAWSLYSIVPLMFQSEASKIDQFEAVIQNLKTQEIYATPMGKDMVEMMEYAFYAPKWINTVTMLLLLIEGLAIFLIFQMKKLGFWIYAISQIVYVAVYSYSIPFPNVFSSLVMGFVLFFTLLFIILYAINLKHLR